MAKTIGLVFETEGQKTPPYDGLSRAELDAIALERGLDIKGCSNKAMVITLLEADDEAQGKETQE